ncbi:MAG: efflux RND transporter permease subunit, partial [Bryobacterales bacterium]|nr:efflux RND transporter permease subunit [Bryobacterales bacterium]
LVERYNMQRVVSLVANLHGQDLGDAARRIRAALGRAGAPPRGVSVNLRGQIPPLEETSANLTSGLAISIAVIFLLLAAFFQSFRVSAAVILTLPAVVLGSVLALLATGSTLNIQSFLGTIMAVGIAAANSILLVSFAETARLGGAPSREAAFTGAQGRLRAILMTASAMIAGMIPLAAGLGEGGSQTAPLGRAVIGGLLGAALATLTVLPAIYAVLMGRSSAQSASLDPSDPASKYYEAS